jgi:hypothetical protein
VVLVVVVLYGLPYIAICYEEVVYGFPEENTDILVL